MVLQHCSNCDGRHPPPLDGRCPFPTCEQPAPKRTTRRTRRSPSLSPPPPPKRGRGQPRTSRSPSMTPPPPPPPTKRGRGRPLGSKGKKKAPPRRHQRPRSLLQRPGPAWLATQLRLFHPQGLWYAATTFYSAGRSRGSRHPSHRWPARQDAAGSQRLPSSRRQGLRSRPPRDAKEDSRHPASPRAQSPRCRLGQTNTPTTQAKPRAQEGHSRPALSRYRQLLAACGAPATQPAPSSTQGCAAPAATHTRRPPCCSFSQWTSRPRHPAGWGWNVQRFHPPRVRRSDPLHRRGTAQESRIGPTAFATDVRPSRSLEGRCPLSTAGPLDPPRGRNAHGLSQKPTDNPPLTAQWPHKKVWLAKTGHWGEYDDLTVEQFVQGYIEIVLPTIPHGPATQIARAHICYLQHTMRDTSSAPWHLVRSTHKQILLMVEHKQLKWENAAARDAIQAKFFDFPAKSTKPGNKPTAQGGAQALPQLQQRYLHPSKEPRHRWDQDVARLCPLL